MLSINFSNTLVRARSRTYAPGCMNHFCTSPYFDLPDKGPWERMLNKSIVKCNCSSAARSAGWQPSSRTMQVLEDMISFRFRSGV